MQDHHNSKRARPSTHKRFTIFMLTAAYIVSCNGAEFSDTSASRSKVIKSPNDENSPNSVINEVSTTGKKAVNGFELTIETYDEKETKEQVQELLFVLDNSASMRDDIDRFKAGISTLFNGLKDGGVKFRTRMVTLDQFIQQTRPVDGIYMPYGITSSGPPNWDRTNLLSDNKTTMNSIYESVKVFEDTLGAQPVIDRLTEISQKFSLFDNEPGLCTAADYLTWLKKHPSRASISPSSAVHVVIVSDEDNARNMQTRDRNTYQLLKTEPLRCFSEKRAATCQDQKYNRLVSTGPIYGYSYQTTGTQYQYSGTYSKRSRCYDQGFSDDKTAVSLKNYISNKAWTKPTYTCNKNVLVPKFSYKLNGVAGTSSTSKANSKSCREPQSYLCQDAKTFQTCTAGTPSSAVWNVQKVAAPISTIRCEEPKSSVCWQLLDGQGFWTPMTTRASALSVMSALGNDKCKEFSDYSVVELSSAASKLPGISSCSSYSCVAGTEAASLTRAAAISFMASGQCSPENLATAPRKDYPSNASESTLALAECYPYTDNTDISTYRTDTFTQVFHLQCSCCRKR
ncbi:MAG: hypothetical protein NTV34_12215 [Proteobacteria bacterium]|nr:hypothetical protein [Pseudomonadota bacterium]